MLNDIIYNIPWEIINVAKHSFRIFNFVVKMICKDDHTDEIDRRVIERVIDHNKRNEKSHMLKHSRDMLPTHDWEYDFKLLGNNYQSNIKRKISAYLFIRQLKPSLNKQDKSIPLNLYNYFLTLISTTFDFKFQNFK